MWSKVECFPRERQTEILQAQEQTVGKHGGVSMQDIFSGVWEGHSGKRIKHRSLRKSGCIKSDGQKSRDQERLKPGLGHLDISLEIHDFKTYVLKICVDCA